MEGQKVAIITGAANGMGEGLTRDLIQKGWKVAIADRDIQRGTTLAKELGPSAKFFPLDVADYDSQANLFQGVWNTWGRLDAALVNAGIIDRGSVYILKYRNSQEIPPRPDTTCTEVCYFGVLYSTQLAIHFMRKNKVPGGKIVVTASTSSIYYHNNFPEYCGAKAAALGFVRSAAAVLKVKDNVTINAILPGMVPTTIAPKEMVAAFKPDWLTPVATIVKGYSHFLQDDTGMTGKALECTQDKLIYAEITPFLNGEVSHRACFVFEPLFKQQHGEYSEVEESVFG